MFHYLLINRLAVIGSLLLAAVLIYHFRRYTEYITTVGLLVTGLCCIDSLQLRNETGIAFVLALLWVTVNITPSFIAQRVSICVVIIIAHFCVFLWWMNTPIQELIVDQTFGYCAFFAGVMLAGANRESMNRRVYHQTKSLREAHPHLKASIPFYDFQELVLGYVKATTGYRLFFRDAEKEVRFNDWFLKDTETLVRRFFIINIVSTTIYVITDLNHAWSVFQSVPVVFLILRFGVLVPLLIASLCFGSIYVKTVRWRVSITAVMMLVYAGVALYMAVALTAHTHLELETMNAIFDYYNSIGLRTIIFGFSGTGLRWIYGSVTGLIVLIAFLIGGALILPSPSAVPALAVLVGIPLIYSEERTRRTKFVLLEYEAEVLEYIRANRALIAAKEALSISVQDTLSSSS